MKDETSVVLRQCLEDIVGIGYDYDTFNASNPDKLKETIDTIVDLAREALKKYKVEKNIVGYEKIKNKHYETPKIVVVKEVKRVAKVGEYIKIVNPFSFLTKANDIHKVSAILNSVKGVIAKGEDQDSHIFYNEEYVVLENYNEYKKETK